jgi:hypothetical protein
MDIRSHNIAFALGDMPWPHSGERPKIAQGPEATGPIEAQVDP